MGGRCLRSQSHLSEHQAEQDEAPLLTPDSADGPAPVAAAEVCRHRASVSSSAARTALAVAPLTRFPVVRGWGTCPCVCRENRLRHEPDTPQPSPALIPNGGYWRLCFKPLLQIKQNRNFSPDLSRPGELPRRWLLSPASRLFSRGASQGAGPSPSAGHQPAVRIQPCFPKAPLTSSSPSASEQAKDTPTHTHPRPFPTHRRPEGPGGGTGTPSRGQGGAGGERGRGEGTRRGHPEGRDTKAGGCAGAGRCAGAGLQAPPPPPRRGCCCRARSGSPAERRAAAPRSHRPPQVGEAPRLGDEGGCGEARG